MAFVLIDPTLAGKADWGDSTGVGAGHQTAVVRCEFVQRGKGVFHLEKREGTRRVRRTGRIRGYRRLMPPHHDDVYEMAFVLIDPTLAGRTDWGDTMGVGAGHQTAVVRCEFVQRGKGVFHLEKREG